jgi:hypothetical protein
MTGLDLMDLRPGAVMTGTARVVRIEPAPAEAAEEVCTLWLRSGSGDLEACATWQLVRDAGVREDDVVFLAGEVEERLVGLGSAYVLAVEVLQTVEPSPTALRRSLLREDDTPILLELAHDLAAYLLWLMCHDLARWTPRRKSRLTQDEVRGLAHYLHDVLPPDSRTPLPMRTDPGRQAA